MKLRFSVRAFCVYCCLAFIAFVYADKEFQICDPTIQLPAPTTADRVTNRSYPSIFQASGPLLVHGLPAPTFESDFEQWFELYTKDEYVVVHDLIFSDFMPYERAFIRHYVTEDQPYHGLSNQIGIEDIAIAKSTHHRRLELNPNHLYLAWDDVHIGQPEFYPKNMPELWLRSDMDGGLFEYNPGDSFYLNILNPDVRTMIVKRIIGYAHCALFDGLMIDSFTVFSSDRHGKIDRNRVSDAMGMELLDAYESIFIEARKNIPPDFLILVNGGFSGKVERFAKYINGSFMECVWEPTHGGYLRQDLVTIEKTLTWNENNLRYPQINCLEGFGFPDEEQSAGPKNKRWMRVFTTLSLTHSDGYVLYNRGGFYIGESGHDHVWHDFWDADLGQPVGGKAQLYENRDGLFIREFTHGWAVYNRSGRAQDIAFGTHVSGTSSEITALSHMLPDMDGEIYLKTKPIDVNADGTVNILDLVLAANSIGETGGKADVNADGIVNILDLVRIANGF